MTIRAYPVGTPVASLNAAAGTPTIVNLTTAVSGNVQGGFVAPTDLLLVTTADGTNKSVTLPDPAKYGGSAGDCWEVVNAASGQTVSVFPPVGGNISGAGANTADTITNNKSACYYLVSFTSSTSVWTSQKGA